MRQHLVLLVEDDADLRQLLERVIQSHGHAFRSTPYLETARQLLAEHAFCGALVDLCIPLRKNTEDRVDNGINLLLHAREQRSPEDLYLLAMTAHGREHHECRRAFRAGCSDFLKKPFGGEGESIDDKLREAARQCEAARRRCLHTRADALHPGSGQSFQADNALHFTGQVRDRRCLLLVDGQREAWVRREAFEVLWRLAVELLRGGGGFVDRARLGSNHYKAVSRTYEALEALGLDRAVVEKDGHGGLRLSIPPGNVSYDRQGLESQHPALLRDLDAR
ncbi:MAG: response regulator [Vicinamibacteria bacterium]